MINKSPFNNLFDQSLLNEIEENSTQISLKAGDVFLEIGQSIQSIPIIISGLIKISRIDEDGKEILLYFINPNESCALTFTCCMQVSPSEIRAVAEEDTVCILLPVRLMESWMTKFPLWKSFVMKTIQQRFAELLKTIDQIAFQKLDERLITYLNEKSKQNKSKLINISHEQIANDLASSRVVISRLLKKLELDEKILLFRNQIKIINEM